MNALYSFFLGLASFFSPCLLPLLPSYLVYIGDISLTLSSDIFRGKKKTLVLHTISFILGFSSVFFSFCAFFGASQKYLIEYKSYIIAFGGFVLILFGLFTIGLVEIPFLGKQLSIDLKRRPHGFLGSFVIGITFALGWSPCVGPAFSSVLFLTLTAQRMGEVFVLALFYCLGLGIPFFFSSIAIDRVLTHFSKIRIFSKYGKIALGAILIFLGLLFVLGVFFGPTLTLLKVPRSF